MAERAVSCPVFVCGRRPGERHVEVCPRSRARQGRLASGCEYLLRRGRYVVPGTRLRVSKVVQVLLRRDDTPRAEE